jgi:hypothetical protein
MNHGGSSKHQETPAELTRTYIQLRFFIHAFFFVDVIVISIFLRLGSSAWNASWIHYAHSP